MQDRLLKIIKSISIIDSEKELYNLLLNELITSCNIIAIEEGTYLQLANAIERLKQII